VKNVFRISRKRKPQKSSPKRISVPRLRILGPANIKIHKIKSCCQDIEAAESVKISLAITNMGNRPDTDTKIVS